MFRHQLLSLVVLSMLTTSASGQYHTQRGASIGGLTGAIAGSIIGDNNGNAGAGAAIGGVVGAMAGGLIGDARDQQEWVERRRAMVYGTNNARATHQISRGVTNQDVLDMVRAGLSDQLIINQISQRGVPTMPTVREIIDLHQRGVSEPVLAALQKAKTNVRQSNPRSTGNPRPTYFAPTTTTILMSPVPYPRYCPPSYHSNYPYYYHNRFQQNFGFHIRF